MDKIPALLTTIAELKQSIRATGKTHLATDIQDLQNELDDVVVHLSWVIDPGILRDITPASAASPLEVQRLKQSVTSISSIVDSIMGKIKTTQHSSSGTTTRYLQEGSGVRSNGYRLQLRVENYLLGESALAITKGQKDLDVSHQFHGLSSTSHEKIRPRAIQHDMRLESCYCQCHVAVEASQSAMANFLMSLDLRPYTPNLNHITAADLAWDLAMLPASHANAALAEELDSHVDLTRRRFTPIHRAVLGLTDESLYDVLDCDHYVVNLTDRDGRTPLFWAVYRGDSATAERLLYHGADVCRDGNALVWSCCDTNQGPACLELLLEYGGDPAQFDTNGFTALQATAITGRQPYFAALLLRHGADPEQAYSGDTETLQGATALHLACLYGPGSALVDVLLHCGSDIHRVSRSGKSALHFAIAQAPSQHIKKHITKDAASIVRTLVESGHRLDCVDGAGNTPAHDAIARQDTASLGVIMAAGANIVWPLSRGPRTNGYHQLAWPIESHNHTVLRYLLTLQSVDIYDINHANNETVLHLLAKSADQKSISIFEEGRPDAKLDPGRVDVHGKTAGDYARGRSDDVAWMLEALFVFMACRRNTLDSVPSTFQPNIREEAGVGFNHEVGPILKELMWNDGSACPSYEYSGVPDNQGTGLGTQQPTVVSSLLAYATQRLLFWRTAKELSSDLPKKVASLKTPGFQIGSWLSVAGQEHQADVAGEQQRTRDIFELRDQVNHCGTELYADYPNTTPVDVAALSEELNNPSTVLAPSSSIPSHGSGISPPTVPAAVHHSNATAQTASTNALSGQSGSSSGPAICAIDTTRLSNANQILAPKFLELCVNTGSLCQSLGEIDATRITSDVELFRWVRRRYRDLRGWRMRSRFCLRPKTMRFVRFGLEQQKKVHILCEDESFPSEDDVKARTYHYKPCPTNPRGSPPMPSNVFIHYLHYCNLDDDVPTCQNTWLNRLPKKLEESVAAQARFAGNQALVEGWGVHVIEGIDGTAVLWTTIVALLVGIAPLLGSYIALTGDVQSATGLASLVVAVIAILMMCMQIEMGKNN
ncbi:hypothetical protein LTR97_006203 [Elasticomyces elasticus]|uniref:Ankyrin repeat protein n=1 Tax=Elasticomyces elasticus TaxID=574655 RepID=A0AAN7WBD4_9PEZI|nr:hypothetical protein LTR97_006203 [Elasticomyces elasticus]